MARNEIEENTIAADLAESNHHIWVELAYGESDRQCLLSLQVRAGMTIKEIIDASGIVNLFPSIDLSQQKIGNYSKPRLLSDKVMDSGERIEIYRALTIEPKEARRLRALKAKV